MKKIYFYGMLAAGLLASCSNDAPATSDVNNNENELARVPITLGASSNGIVQREVVESINGKTIGVFALAKDMDAWNWEATANDGTCILKDIKGTVGEEGKITWTPTATYYYPVMSNHYYSFFGYYPTDEDNAYQATNHGTVNDEEVITVSYVNLDGTQDLICGNAVAEAIEGQEGYNAAYMRKSRAQRPDIQLKHRLIQLIITVNGADGNAHGEEFKIDKVELLNAPKSLDMVVATHGDVSEVLKIGDILVNPEVNEIGTYTLTPAEEITLAYLSERATELGKVMLPAWSLRENKFKAAITISTIDGTPIHGNESSYSKEFEIQAPSASQFEVGKSYTINLIIKDPQEVEAKATLTDWVSAGTASDITIE